MISITATSRMSCGYVLQRKPTLMIKNPNAKGNDKFEGFMVDLLAKVADEVGFTYKIYIAPDGGWEGYRMEGGKKIHTGMIGELIYKVKLQHNNVSPG